MKKTIIFVKKNIVEIILIAFSLIFSFWLMFSTFSYKDGSMFIASKAWSDFASTIPLIRSFSFGANFPPQYPIFPGLPIHYHFLFYAFVGLLEKAGIRIDYALNIPSALGFAGLLILIYFFAKKIFKNTAIGIVSVILFLFNGSLSFLEFFKIHPLSASTLNDVILNKTFPSFGPYDEKIVSAFWNLNIYTNQRHLAAAFALSLLIIFLFLQPILKDRETNFKLDITLGLILGASFFFHLAVFLMTMVVLIILGLLFSKLRRSALGIILIGGVIALPQYLYLESGGTTFKPFFSPGYLISFNLTLFSFINYWVQNLGLHIILIPLGFAFAPKNARKILLAFSSLFIIGNTLQFSPEMAANHKFFNYFMIIGVMFSAYFLIYLWKKILLLKPLVIILFFFLIFSGLIDFFPVYNDAPVVLHDYPVDPEIRWIMKNTPPNSVFLNTQYLYDPASLAGRKIFLGWPYFSWSAGYDTLTRDNLRKNLLSTNDLVTFCNEILRYNINYVELSQSEGIPDFLINEGFFEKNLNRVYYRPQEQYKIYSTKERCIKT